MTRIVVAEDDPDILHLLEYKLGRSGFEVVGATSGTAVLNEVRRSRPHLLILDVRMPGMSGLEVCRELRAEPETADVPVLMVTAYARPTDREAAFAAGADDYLAKPFSPRELVHRVEAMLARVGT